MRGALEKCGLPQSTISEADIRGDAETSHIGLDADL